MGVAAVGGWQGGRGMLLLLLVLCGLAPVLSTAGRGGRGGGWQSLAQWRWPPPCKEAPPRCCFWGACVRGGAADEPSSSSSSHAPTAGLLVAPEQEQEQEQDGEMEEAAAAPAAGAIEPIVLTEEEAAVLELVNAAESWERVLALAAKLPAVRACPDFHLRIANAGRGDAGVAATALRRLGKLVGEVGGSEAERAAVRAKVGGDRRFEQLLECVACQVEALGPVEASNALFALAALRVEGKEEGEELLAALLQSAAAALAKGRWVGLQPSDAVTLAVSLAHVVAFLPPLPPAQLLPLLEALEARLMEDAPLLSPHDLSRLAGALAAMAGKRGGGNGGRGRREAGMGHQHHHHHGPLLRLMGEIVRRHPQSFAPRDLATVADALASLGQGQNATMRAGVAAACAGRLAELPPEDLATLARALAAWAGAGEEGAGQGTTRVEVVEDSLMLELLVCAEARRGDLGPRHTADVLFAFGRHGFRNATAFMLRELPGLFARADGRLAEGSPEAFSPSDLAKVVWAYAKLLPRPTGRARLPATAFASAAAAAAEPTVGKEKDASSGGINERMEASLGAAAAEQQQQQQPEPEQFAMVEQPQQHLLSALAGRAAVLVRHALATEGPEAVEPPLLVALAWAIVTLGHRDEGLLGAVGEVLASQLDALSLPEIARAAWALTEGRGGDGPRTAFFDALALLVELHHRQFRLSDLALCLWALASRGYDGVGLRLFRHYYAHQLGGGAGAEEDDSSAVNVAVSTFLRPEELQALHPSDEARLLWALARLRVGEEEVVGEAVVDAVCRDLQTKLATLSPHDLGLTLAALARFSVVSSVPPSEARAKLQAQAARHLPPWLDAFSSPELAALLQSLLALGQPPEEAALAEAAHALVERRLRGLLDRVERADGAKEQQADDETFFHLSRCQQLLGLWRRTNGAAAAAAAKTE